MKCPLCNRSSNTIFSTSEHLRLEHKRKPAEIEDLMLRAAAGRLGWDPQARDSRPKYALKHNRNRILG